MAPSARLLLAAGEGGIADEYVRKGWYFVAARIRLGQGVSFKTATATRSKDTATTAAARKTVQAQLSSGELHPLLISFDTVECVFPLRISAVGGKPSEVSVYVLSTEPVLNGFMFDKVLEKLGQRRTEWERTASERERTSATSLQNARTLQMAWLMHSLLPPPVPGARPEQDWTLEDLVALGKEGQPSKLPEPLEGPAHALPGEPPQCLQAKPEQIQQCTQALPRLKNRSWWLTKQVQTFRPEEMHDLVFPPAIPTLARALLSPDGSAAATVLYHCGNPAVPVLLSAVQSTNPFARVNASSVLQSLKGQPVAETLPALLRDEVPQVRLNAVMATAAHWDPRFVAPLIALFRDPHNEIRWQAAQWLCLHEPKERSPVYAVMLEDPNPDVQACALQVLGRIGPDAAPRAGLLRLLGSPRLDVMSRALRLLQGPQSDWPGLPPALNLRGELRAETNRLSSAEASPLLTNQLTLARLVGLKILRRNADAEAVTLALPLLRDTNHIVRHRAFDLLRAVSGQDIQPDDSVKWEEWWAANRGGFTAREPRH